MLRLKVQARKNAVLLHKSFVQGVITTANQSDRRRRGWEDRHHVGSALLLPPLQANVGYSCKTTCTAKGCLLARYYSDDRSLSLSWSWLTPLAGAFSPQALHGRGVWVGSSQAVGADMASLRQTGGDCRSGPGGRRSRRHGPPCPARTRGCARGA